MKKFSLKNYWKPTPENLQKVSELIEAFLGLFGASSIVSGHPALAAWILIAAGITNKFFKLFG